VHSWRVQFDRKAGHTHVTRKGFGHALMAPIAANVFRALGVSASVWDGEYWWPIHLEPSVTSFELEHSADSDRIAYNQKHLKRASSTGCPALGKLGGYSDLFVPVIAHGEVVAVLVCGAFSSAAPTAETIGASWRRLSGRQAHLDDPEFSMFLERALSTLVLEGKRLKDFERFLRLVAGVFAEEQNAGELATQIERLRVTLQNLRFPERVWAAVDSMLDARAPRTWSSGSRVADLRSFGLDRTPGLVLVALFAEESEEVDPIDASLRRHAFQRAMVEHCHELGNLIAGRVGRRGVVFLSSGPGSEDRERQRLRDVFERVIAIARRKFGLSLRAGMSGIDDDTLLAQAYRAALSGAESAPPRRLVLVADKTQLGAPDRIRQRRRDLDEALRENPGEAVLRFEQYLDAVEAADLGRTDLAQAHLDFGLERLTEPLVQSGTLDARSQSALHDTVARGAERASSVSTLVAVYRDAARELSSAAVSPTRAHQDRNLRRAIEYIHQHYAKPVSSVRVAKIAGFAPTYFSKLFKRREKVTFEAYVSKLRLDRAKQLLASTSLDVTRIAERSGFSSSQYLSRVFKQSLQMTPLEYRRSLPQTSWTDPAPRRTRAER
jgi:AraC-like DNA-binding protein